MTELPPPRGAVRLPGGRRNLAKSATRALDILEHLAIMKRPMRAIEIGHVFGWRASSTDQLLKTMVDSGYLIFDSSQKFYRPSPRLARFAAWLTATYYGDEKLHRLLALIHGRTGETATLAVRQDSHMQVVDLVSPPCGPQPLPRGLKVPLIGSALGSAYLAARSDSEVREIVCQIDRHRADPAARVPAVQAEVAECRARGYAAGGITASPDMTSLAMSLPSGGSEVGLVLGFAGRFLQREAELAHVLRSCIDEILGPASDADPS